MGAVGVNVGAQLASVADVARWWGKPVFFVASSRNTGATIGMLRLGVFLGVTFWAG